MAAHMPGKESTRVPLLGQCVKLARAHFDDRKLARDKESI